MRKLRAMKRTPKAKPRKKRADPAAMFFHDAFDDFARAWEDARAAQDATIKHVVGQYRDKFGPRLGAGLDQWEHFGDLLDFHRAHVFGAAQKDYPAAKKGEQVYYRNAVDAVFRQWLKSLRHLPRSRPTAQAVAWDAFRDELLRPSKPHPRKHRTRR